MPVRCFNVRIYNQIKDPLSLVPICLHFKNDTRTRLDISSSLSCEFFDTLALSGLVKVLLYINLHLLQVIFYLSQISLIEEVVNMKGNI